MVEKVDVVLLSDPIDIESVWRVSSFLGINRTTPEERYWPNQWLLRDLENNAKIFDITFGTPDWSNCSAPLLRISWGILHQLEKQLKTSKNPLVIITKGLGGIIVKQMCLCAPNVPQFWEIFKQISGIVFYCCPHECESSSDMAEILMKIQIQESFDKLVLASQSLIALNEEFKELLSTNIIFNSLKILSFGENHNLTSHRVIPRNISNPSFGDYYELPGKDFSTISSVRTPEDFGYWKILTMIRNILRKQKKINNDQLKLINDNQQHFKENEKELIKINFKKLTIKIQGRILTIIQGDYDKNKPELFKILYQEIQFESIFEVLVNACNIICEKLEIQMDNLSNSIKDQKLNINMIGIKYQIDLAKIFVLYHLQISPSSSSLINIEYIEKNINNEPLSKDKALILEIKSNGFKEQLLPHLDKLNNLLKSSEISLECINRVKEILNQKPRISLLGRPNSGKSTLINGLCGNSWFSTASSECTGTITELHVNKAGETTNQNDSSVDLVYISEKELDSSVAEYISQHIQRGKDNDSIKEIIKSFKDKYEETMQSNNRQKIMNVSGKKYFSQEWISDYASLNSNNNFNCLLLEKIILHAKKDKLRPWLQDVILCDTPGLFSRAVDQEGVFSLTDKRAFDSAENSDIWIYLTPHQDINDELATDLSKVISRAPHGKGLVCLTKFDYAFAAIKKQTLSTILENKRNRILECCRMPNPPGLSAYVLELANQYIQAKKNRAVLMDELLKRLSDVILAHTGKTSLYFLNHIENENDQEQTNDNGDNDDGDDDDDDDDDSDDPFGEEDDSSVEAFTLDEYFKFQNKNCKSTQEKADMVRILYCASLEASLAHSFLEHVSELLKVTTFNKICHSLESLLSIIAQEIHSCNIQVNDLKSNQISNNNNNILIDKSSTFSSISSPNRLYINQINDNISISPNKEKNKFISTNNHKREKIKIACEQFCQNWDSYFSMQLRQALNNAIIPLQKSTLSKLAQNVMKLKANFLRIIPDITMNIDQIFISDITKLFKNEFSVCASQSKISSWLGEIPAQLKSVVRAEVDAKIHSCRPLHDFLLTNPAATQVIFKKKLFENRTHANEMFKEKANEKLKKLITQLFKEAEHLKEEISNRVQQILQEYILQLDSTPLTQSSTSNVSLQPFVVSEKIKTLQRTLISLRNIYKVFFNIYNYGVTSEQYCSVLVGSQLTNAERNYISSIFNILYYFFLVPSLSMFNNDENQQSKTGSLHYEKRLVQACLLEFQTLFRANLSEYLITDQTESLDFGLLRTSVSAVILLTFVNSEFVIDILKKNENNTFSCYHENSFLPTIDEEKAKFIFYSKDVQRRFAIIKRH